MQILERPADRRTDAVRRQLDQTVRSPQRRRMVGRWQRRAIRRMVSTSADELEEAFMRRKRRELEQARMAGGGEAPQVQQVVRGQEKVGRNDPCPCGSGKKYKKCHGA